MTIKDSPEKEKDIFSKINGKRYQTYNYFCVYDEFGRSIFKPALVAQYLAKFDNFKTDFKSGILFYYNGRHWVRHAEAYLEKILTKILENENRSNYFREILHNLKGETYCEITFSNKIAVENGLFNVETQELTPFDPQEMPFYSIPVKYNPEARCPKFEAFIKQVVSLDDLPLLQEWSGYLLLSDYRFQNLMWLYGKGRNGKGVWARTMEAVLGENNISSIGLEEFDGNHRFAMERLYGKLFNICSEPTTNRVLQTSLLKKATGQDTIEAEIKGKQSRIKFRNCGKITILANRFPKVYDSTTAFKDRRLLLNFPKEFLQDEQIQNIEDNWLKANDERSGILNWMLEGLKRLLSQGHFTESKTQQETDIEFQRQSDTIGAFLSELGIFDKVIVTTRSEAYEAYKDYCDFYGLTAQTEKAFTPRLKETPHVRVCRILNVRAWGGIGFKPLLNEEDIANSTPGTESTPFTYWQALDKSSDIISGSWGSVHSVLPVHGHVVSIKPSNGEKCRRCQTVASEYEIKKFVDGQLSGTDYNCITCLIEKAFPALQEQGVKIYLQKFNESPSS